MRLAEIETVTNNLSLLRGGAGLSQQELADAIGVSRKTISTIETARFMPSVVIALKLAAHFAVPVEQIFQLAE
ncbi:transcriptional regulator [Aliidiomarina iranensis]|uniref:Transcriptional regulator n=1 Tax=Aliidiomarina iranensis TaxID=1434071 RepID=A0A432VVK5_9GAMM|nr:helix-turn-helix transcriptional regulator [Aliidiomarina iranensis]RUO20418.1 transcriptional regulator [Aliidiomarina iranensis]